MALIAMSSEERDSRLPTIWAAMVVRAELSLRMNTPLKAVVYEFSPY